MQLISLKSNLTNFKSIYFKKGLNVIVGERTDPNNKDTKDSYNGVGKSLIIEIIHFCFGSNKISAFSKNIPEAEFYLEFKDEEGIIHEIKRECSSKQDIYLDQVKYETLTKFHEEMSKYTFPNVNIQKGITFRSLFARFVRRYKNNYTKYYNFVKSEPPYNENLVNSFLLGLDTSIFEKKKINKDNTTTLTNAKKSLQEDKLLNQYFKGNKDIKFKLSELKDQKERLEKNISEFKVAENYYEKKKEADKLSLQKKELVNKIFINERNVNKIKETSDVEIKLQASDLIKLYEEAEIVFEDKIVKSIKEVSDFHNNLLLNRKNNFQKKLDLLEKENSKLKIELIQLSNELNTLLSFLDKHGALNEYVLLNETYRKISDQYEKLLDYNKLLKEYEYELSMKKKDREDIKIEIKEYLDSSSDIQEELMDVFKSFSKEFYKDKSSGLSINPNYRNNKVSWDIHADIEDDSSDGVNEVLIYSFDFTLFTVNKEKINFMIHDSRLFTNMDPRQRYTALVLANEYLEKNPDKQYIVSLNEDMIISMRDMVDTKDYKEIENIILDSKILTLKDDLPINKLLGFQKNIPYDK